MMSIMQIYSDYKSRRKARKGLNNEHREWILRGYASPSPSDIKRRVLLRLGTKNAIWVETGTFMGDTTALISEGSKEVYTIEPDNVLFEKANARFLNNPYIHVIHGLSEDVFPTLLPTLSGTINFWLDGHYSGGITHKGPTDCPVVEELLCIEKNLSKFNNVTILIDDIRCFDPSIPEYADYPDINFLVDWARKNALNWHIEHDIFVARSTVSHNSYRGD
ncbi:hypothetical protein KI809_14725 [Geobacter pelophilus]|uniref:FkbM family methyltransferase n=1 Tax=Geoanaerobacter pelophilus TaxID=60036 RepID=A0AAW4LAG3_9BACT|nr:hypothetical protein [Geoanaerobacter pelophilus]MBT0665560.1 hypothetical protein [Geoanaerobacter pelophilus]